MNHCLYVMFSLCKTRTCGHNLQWLLLNQKKDPVHIRLPILTPFCKTACVDNELTKMLLMGDFHREEDTRTG